jgi:signal transduction histidine kinase
MKFFAKLFLCVTLVLTAALATAEYFTVSASFRSTMNHQTEEALQQHQLVKYALQADLLTALGQGTLSQTGLQDLAAQTGEALSVSLELEELSAAQAEEAGTDLSYTVRQQEETEELVVVSCFSQSGYQLRLTTTQDISDVFRESQALEQSCGKIFLLATGSGALATLLLSWLLTRPMKRLEETSRTFAEGDYDARLAPTSKDEIGDLTRTFNQMADTIQEKIAALELAVEQREDFVANFAHELKTPMTSIIGYADTLYQRELPAHQVQEAAGYILNEGLRLEALSFKLLELITLEKQTFLLEEMELTPFFRDMQESIRTSAAQRGVEVQFQWEEGYVRMEYDLFKTMLLNLLDNALKSGGTLVTVTGSRQKNGYSIAVEDNGRGIPEGELKRITEAFYMVDKSRSRKEHGAGLGLALCQRIAAIHGATLEFDSIEGVGTTVEVLLPQEEEVEQ